MNLFPKFCTSSCLKFTPKCFGHNIRPSSGNICYGPHLWLRFTLQLYFTICQRRCYILTVHNLCVPCTERPKILGRMVFFLTQSQANVLLRCVLCAVRPHGTQYTPQLETLFYHNVAEHITTYCY